MHFLFNDMKQIYIYIYDSAVRHTGALKTRLHNICNDVVCSKVHTTLLYSI